MRKASLACESAGRKRLLQKSTPALIAAVIALGLLASASRGLAATLVWTNGSANWDSTTAWQTNLFTAYTNDYTGGVTNQVTNSFCVVDLPPDSIVITNCAGGSGIPTTPDEGLFTNSSSYEVKVNSATTVRSLTFTSNSVVTLDASANTLTVTNVFGVGSGGNTATVYWAGGTLAVTGVVSGVSDDGAIHIGFGDTNNNTLGIMVVTNGTVIFGNGTPSSSSAYRGLELGANQGGEGRLVISGPGVVTNRIGGVGTLATRGAESQVIVTNGGKLFLRGEYRISSNNFTLVSDPGSIISCSDGAAAGSGGFACGFGSVAYPNSSMFIVSNGATIWAAGTISVGRNSVCNTGIVVGAGSQLISGPAGNIYVSISGGTDNDYKVYDGGYLECGGPALKIAASAGSPRNSLHMGGVGAMSTGVAHEVSVHGSANTASLVVTNAMFTCTRVNFIGDYSNNVSVLSKGTVIISDTAYAGTQSNSLVLNNTDGALTIDAGTISVVSGTNAFIFNLGGSSNREGNSMTITNGGKLLSEMGTIGANSSFSTGIVSGAGSVWSNYTAIASNDLVVGSGTTSDGSLNYLAVRNGATLVNNGSLLIGNSGSSTLNSVLFGGSGAPAVIINSGMINIGAGSGTSGNSLTISNASVTCDALNVGGTGSNRLNNTVAIYGGTISATSVRVRSTNTLVFTAGTLSAGGMDIDTDANSGNVFVVGDGASAAYYDMAAGGTGLHDFNNGGLVITNGASLRGNGTITGTTTVLGTFVPGFANTVGTIFSSNSVTFGSSAVLDYDLGTSSDSVTVGGDLQLGGTLNITDAGGFGVGSYTLFTYAGTLTDNGLAVGTTPNPTLSYTIDTGTVGSVNLNVTGVPPAASFTASPTNGTAPLAIVFTDTSTGSITNRFWDFGDASTTNTTDTTMNHTYSAGGVYTVSLLVDGPAGSSTNTQSNYIVVLNPPQLVVSPANLTFGSMTIGLSNSLNFSVINTGDLTLTGTATSAAPFTVTSGGSYNLAGGQTQTVTVAFAPTSAITSTGSVIFASDGGDSTNQVIGTGLTLGSISVTPASQDFGNVATGLTAFASFVVTNTGGTAVSNGTATALGGPFTVTAGATFSVAGFGTTNVTVQFAPVSIDVFTNEVAFASDNGGEATNTVIGTGIEAIPPVASFTATPTNGVTPLDVTFTDTSTGTITNRFWNFGDGTTTNTTSTNFVHTYSVNPPGDVSKDGKVTITDSLFINQALASLRATNSATFQANYTVSLIVEGPAGSSTNTQSSLVGLNVYPNGDVNTNGVVNSGDSLFINQVIATLRSYVVTKCVPSSRSNDVPTTVSIYGIGFPTSTVTSVTIGAPVNLTLSNVVAVSSVQITALVPAGGGLGTGTVSVIATPSNNVTSFGRFISQ